MSCLVRKECASVSERLLLFRIIAKKAQYSNLHAQDLPRLDLRFSVRGYVLAHIDIPQSVTIWLNGQYSESVSLCYLQSVAC